MSNRFLGTSYVHGNYSNVNTWTTLSSEALVVTTVIFKEKWDSGSGYTVQALKTKNDFRIQCGGIDELHATHQGLHPTAANKQNLF
jgi:hypothetical protein